MDEISSLEKHSWPIHWLPQNHFSTLMVGSEDVNSSRIWYKEATHSQDVINGSLTRTGPRSLRAWPHLWSRTSALPSPSHRQEKQRLLLFLDAYSVSGERSRTWTKGLDPPSLSVSNWAEAKKAVTLRLPLWACAKGCISVAPSPDTKMCNWQAWNQVKTWSFHW